MNADDWRPACDRGAFTMIVRTRAETEAFGIAAHPEAKVVGEVRPDDDRPTIYIGFANPESLREFIAGLAPRAVSTTAEAAVFARPRLSLVAPSRPDIH